MLELLGFLICLLLFFVLAGMVEQKQSKREDLSEYRQVVRDRINKDSVWGISTLMFYEGNRHG